MSDREFRILGTETVGQIGFLEIQNITVESPAGPQVNRIAIRHPGAVAVIPIIGSSVVLIRQYRAAVNEWLLEIPAGKLDQDGEAPRETAHRELEEEVGLKAGRLEPIGEFFTTPGFSDELMYLYVAYDLEETQIQPVGPEEETAEILRVEIETLPEWLEQGKVRDAKTLIGLWWVVANRP